MSKTWEELVVGDKIEITIGPGTQRGVVTKNPGTGLLRARFWSSRRQDYYKQDKLVSKDVFITTVEHVET